MQQKAAPRCYLHFLLLSSRTSAAQLRFRLRHYTVYWDTLAFSSSLSTHWAVRFKKSYHGSSSSGALCSSSSFSASLLVVLAVARHLAFKTTLNIFLCTLRNRFWCSTLRVQLSLPYTRVEAIKASKNFNLSPRR